MLETGAYSLSAGAQKTLCLSQQVVQAHSRRMLLSLVAGGAALLGSVSPSEAAFGDSANVFGKATNTSGARG